MQDTKGLSVSVGIKKLGVPIYINGVMMLESSIVIITEYCSEKLAWGRVDGRIQGGGVTHVEWQGRAALSP